MIVALIAGIAGLTIILIGFGYLMTEVDSHALVVRVFLLVIAFMNLITMYVCAALWVGSWLRRMFGA